LNFMRRGLVVLLFFLGVLVHLSAQTTPVVRAVAVTPDPANRLASQQALYVRLAYESDQPLRFQAAGYFQGKKHERLMMNPSATYPAGKGEAVAWVAGDPGARLDEIRVRVCDAGWKQLFEVSTPVQAEWHAGIPSAPAAPWAKTLSDAQQHAVGEALKNPPPPSSLLEKLWGGLVAVLVPLAFLSVPGYPILQVYAFFKLRGPARLLSALPLSFMGPVYLFCLTALSQGSNLWPLYAIFASPIAFIITLAVVIIARRRQAAAIAA
jgi:hypothetical protein